MIGGLLLLLLGACWLLEAGMGVPIGMPVSKRRAWVGVAFLVLGMAVMSLCAPAHANAAPSSGSAAHTVHIPDISARYRLLVEQAAVSEWGVDASPARLAAQLHQESSWNPKAQSSSGAQGLAQFMPKTGQWLAQQFPELGAYDPWDPAWSARAAAVYDHWLLTRNPGVGQCSNWSFALSAYNGGETALHREQALATRHGGDGKRWFRNTADYRSRSVAAWQQNRQYVQRILLLLEPAYIDAGWAGQAVCV